MAQFMFAYYDARQPDSPEEGAALMQRWQQWVMNLGDAALNPGTPLGPIKSVTADGVADGGGARPMMGFSVIEAPDLDAALVIAEACPHREIGTVEVAEMKQFG